MMSGSGGPGRGPYRPSRGGRGDSEHHDDQPKPRRRLPWFAMIMATLGFGYAAFFDSAVITRPPLGTFIIIAIWLVVILALTLPGWRRSTD
jgi:hypothetical protein